MTRKTTSTWIFEEHGVENCFVELIESKDNKVIPDRKDKEYKVDNKNQTQTTKDKILWRINEVNKDKIKK